MNIIKTDIVNSNIDAFWDDISQLVPEPVLKPVLVLVSEFENETVESAQLQKMLEAGCKLTSSHYHIVRLKHEDRAAWHKLREKLDPKIIFLIGVMPIQLGISALFQINFPNNFDERIWLPTLSVCELEKNAGMKRQLWENGMNPVFVDKKFGAI